MSAEKMGGLDNAFNEPDPNHRQEVNARFSKIIDHNYGPLRRFAQIGRRFLGHQDPPQEKPYGAVTNEITELLLNPFAIDAPRASETSSPEPTPKPIS